MQYTEHAMGKGAKVAAVAYVKICIGKDKPFYGVGINTDISIAAIRVLVSACNRALEKTCYKSEKNLSSV